MTLWRHRCPRIGGGRLPSLWRYRDRRIRRRPFTSLRRHCECRIRRWVFPALRSHSDRWFGGSSVPTFRRDRGCDFCLNGRCRMFRPQGAMRVELIERRDARRAERFRKPQRGQRLPHLRIGESACANEDFAQPQLQSLAIKPMTDVVGFLHRRDIGVSRFHGSSQNLFFVGGIHVRVRAHSHSIGHDIMGIWRKVPHFGKHRPRTDRSSPLRENSRLG